MSCLKASTSMARSFLKETVFCMGTGLARVVVKPTVKWSHVNQITFILHIQGVFSLPGRGFHQRVTLISSVPMTLDDIIVHVRQFIIALISVDGCSSFFDPDGFLEVPDSSVGFLVYNVHSLPVYDVVFSCRMVCKGGFIDGRHQSFFPAPCAFLFFRVVYILSVFHQSCF